MSAESIYIDSPEAGPGCSHARGFRHDEPLDVRGLMFGLADVLYDATVWRRWLLQLVSRLGVSAPYHSFFASWDGDYYDAVARGEREFGEAFQAFLSAAGLTRSQIDEVEAASQARRRAIESQTRPLPGVRATLGRLRQAGIKMAVLADSEHSAERLMQQLTRMGLGEAFMAVVSSFDLERTKPDPTCYRETLAAMGLDSADVAFVGHGAGELRGARDAGMTTVAFNYCPQALADRYLTRFDELLDLTPATSGRSSARTGVA